jgi:hypothetical protein
MASAQARPDHIAGQGQGAVVGIVGPAHDLVVVAEHLERQIAVSGRARGDQRPGHQHPVPRSGHRLRHLQRTRQVFGDLDGDRRARPDDRRRRLHPQQRRGTQRRGRGHDHVRSNVAQGAEDPLDVLVVEARDHHDQLPEPERLVEGGRDRARTVGVVGTVEHDGRLAAHHLEPARHEHRAEPVPHHVVVHRVERHTRERGERRQRQGGVAPLVGPVQGQHHLVDLAVPDPQAQQLSAHRDPLVGDAEVDAGPPRATPCSATARSTTSCTAGTWRAVTTCDPGLTIPTFSAATSTGVAPSSGWSTSISLSTATSERTRLVASHLPPMPTSNTPTSTGASANQPEGHRREHLEVRDRVGLGARPLPCGRVHQVGERRHLVVDLREPALGDVPAGQRQALPDVWRCGEV